MVDKGDKAPTFTLESSEGGKVKLADLSGKWVVLYFYPKDDTPGCTVEAKDFTAAVPELQKRGAVVFGVSKDSIAAHCKFRDKHGLGIPLLSDPEAQVMTKYGAWGEKVLYGKKSVGVIRSTFLISPDGKIAEAWRRVKVAGHVEKVLAALDAARA